MRRKDRESQDLAARRVLSLLGGAAGAETYTVGSIEIGNPWARATPKGAPVGGAYMTITNKGAEADRLMGASSPVASEVEIHRCPWTTASCPCGG